jgi:hypothetical protein
MTITSIKKNYPMTLNQVFNVVDLGYLDKEKDFPRTTICLTL